MDSGTPPPHQTLADFLRELDETVLGSLLTARPDVITPPPGDFDALAARASSLSSLDRALESLDQFTVEILAALAHAEADARYDELSTHLRSITGAAVPQLALRRAIRRLEGLFLVWLSDGWLRRTITPDTAAKLDLPKPDRLQPDPPLVTGVDVSVAMLDRSGAGEASETIRRVDALLEACSHEPPEQLRAGGISSRDLRRLATTVGVETHTVTLLLEICHTAGLLETHDTDTGLVWLPTVAFDHWRSEDGAVRWETLARSWLNLPRLPALAERRDDRGRRIAPLSEQLDRPLAPAIRQRLLAPFAELPAERAVTFEEVLATLRWSAPRRAVREETGPDGSHLEVFATTFGEAVALGILSAAATAPRHYGLSGFGRAMIAGGDPVPVLEELLPKPTEDILVQADLTVVAPGPLTELVARKMALVATVESAGAATVYRVDVQSLRHALDAGWVADELHRFFAEHSRTPIPQSLTYLIDDVARRHGGVRVGAAAGYLRSDDEALLATIMADRRCEDLRLRRLAPTVLISKVNARALVAALREAGYPAAAEDDQGALVVRAPRQQRTVRRVRRTSAETSAPSLLEERVADAIARLREGEQRRRVLQRLHRLGDDQGRAVATDTDEMVRVISQVITEKGELWLGFIDPHGAMTRRLVRPLSISAGFLRAEDERTETSHTFALHRITSVALPEYQ